MPEPRAATRSPTGCAAAGSPRADLNGPLYLLATALNMLPADAVGPVLPKPPDRIEFFATRFEQTADEFSGFGQMNWHFTKRWTMLYGMRLDYTRKTAGASLPSFLRDVDLTSGLGVQYTDNRYLNDTADPRTRQPSVFLLDASVGLQSESQGWSMRLRVDNLTDETTAITAYEALPAGGVVFKASSTPRLVSGGFRWEF